MYATLTPLGEQVHKICEARGIKLGYVAARMGLPDSSLSRILHGHRPEPRWTAMITMAEALGVSLDELAGRQVARVTADDMREIGAIVEEAERIGREDEKRRQRLGWEPRGGGE